MIAKVRGACAILSVVFLAAGMAQAAMELIPAGIGEGFGQPALSLVHPAPETDQTSSRSADGYMMDVPMSHVEGLGNVLVPNGGERVVSAGLLRTLAGGVHALRPYGDVWRGRTRSNAFVLSRKGGIAAPLWPFRANILDYRLEQALQTRTFETSPELALALGELKTAVEAGNKDGATALTEQIARMVDGAAKGKETSMNARGEIAIAPGEFRMGSPETEEGRFDGEFRHLVVLTHPIAVRPTTLSRGEYKSLGLAPHWNTSDGRPDELPATYVSWLDGVEALNAMSQRDGLEPAYLIEDKDGRKIVRVNGENIYKTEGWRYPTEAELERLIRGGTDGPYWFDPVRIAEHAWYGSNSHGQVQVPGAAWHANPFGVIEAVGNALQWAHDFFAPYSRALIVANPSGPDRPTREYGSFRGLRGGSWYYGAGGLRSAVRGYGDPVGRDDVIAVRPVRSVVGP